MWKSRIIRSPYMKMKKYAKCCVAYMVFWLRYFEITKQILNK